MDDKQIKLLIDKAMAASQNAICDFSNFRVGAAILSKDGSVFTGCNIENSSLTMVICAERVALYKALSEGCKEFTAIAIAAEGHDFCPPCGSCRQLLFEFAPDLKVIMADSKKNYTIKKIEELLPMAFKFQKK
ncbi:MAG: cytidine deaminase [Nitrospirae bacterium RBG_19FT_COMBO_42_15]|nr:MAG: cytidine deaminase [Nitrospirae bacterium RBG_19FT_COMBO_42_15]